MADLIPPGYYDAVAAKSTLESEDGETTTAKMHLTTTKDGHPQVLVWFTILDGPYAGRVVPWNGYLTEKTQDRTRESLKYIGMKGGDFWKANAEQPLDQIVSIKVEHNEFDGKVRARVAWVNKRGGGKVKIKGYVKEAELRKFSAQMLGFFSGAPDVEGERMAGAAPQARATGTAPPVSPPDDDIPF